MGKRHSTFTGLSRFVLEAFKQGDDGADSAQKRSPDAEPNAAQPPVKKRKVGLLGPGREHLDATGLVPYYTDASEVPDRLRKYFFQRERYFSLYAQGTLLDEEGWYSVTPELIANQIAERCRCTTIVDAFCGVGGNAIAFAQTCERVITLDISPTRLALARHNAAIYGVENRIEFILGDYLSFARSLAASQDEQGSKQPGRRKVDVVFLSPPWGGPEYLAGSAGDAPPADPTQHPEFSLASVQPVHGAELFALTRKITPNVAYYLPRNTRLEEISALIPSGEGTPEKVEVEEEWMGSKLKALTCYFGGLAAGQEELFDE